jgi:hypothetical protein
MAVTTLQSPASIGSTLPAFSPQIFLATSNQIAQPNFVFTVKCTDVITGSIATFAIAKDPIYNTCVFDASSFSQQFMQFYKPLFTSGFQKADGSIRPITVNIGESYGSTVTYYAGTNCTYYVWTGIIDWLGYAGGTFTTSKYYYDIFGATGAMVGLYNDVTFTGRSNFIYFLSDLTGANRPTGISVLEYDAAGGLIITTAISNTHSGGGNTYDKNFVCLDVGARNFTFLNSFTVRYEIRYGGNVIKNIKRGCENMYAPKVVHFLAKNGAFQSAYFNLKDTRKITKDSQKFSKNPAVNTGTVYNYGISDAVDLDFGIVSQKQITLRTDWLSDEQVQLYSELFDSPICYLDGDDDYPNNLLRIRPTTPEYKMVKKYNQKLYSLEQDFVFAHQNLRQRVY